MSRSAMLDRMALAESESPSHEVTRSGLTSTVPVALYDVTPGTDADGFQVSVTVCGWFLWQLTGPINSRATTSASSFLRFP